MLSPFKAREAGTGTFFSDTAYCPNTHFKTQTACLRFCLTLLSVVHVVSAYVHTFLTGLQVFILINAEFSFKRGVGAFFVHFPRCKRCGVCLSDI